MKMLKKSMKYVKWLWIILIIVFTSAYFSQNHDKVSLIFSELPSPNLFFSVAFIVLGKMLLVLSMFFSLQYVAAELSFRRCFYIYNVSQLAKYIPGFIWQFVGRIGAYVTAGLDKRKIRNSMILEFACLSSGAFFFGVLFLSMSDVNFFSPFYREFKVYITGLLVIIGLAVVGLFVVKWNVINTCLNAARRQGKLNRKIFVTQLGIWLFLGLSFSVLIQPYLTEGHRFFIIGLFALAYVIGFTFPFASAGIGIRESIIILGISGILQVDHNVAIMISALHRVIYTMLEVFLAGVSFVFVKMSDEVVESS